jgi:branched-chain amino acid transport system substrate-binding protein
MLAAGPAHAAEPPKDPKVFRFGALLGLTDKGNWNAVVMQRGITMAVDEINAAGGIDGIKMEAEIEDHQGVPRVGVDAMQRLRARYDIQSVLLSYSTVGLAMAPIGEASKIFMPDGGSVIDNGACGRRGLEKIRWSRGRLRNNAVHRKKHRFPDGQAAQHRR